MQKHQTRISNRIARFGLALAAGLVALSLTSCGGNDATFEAVINIDAADEAWSLPDDWGYDSTSTPVQKSLGPALPIRIEVHSADTNSTPVAGANVTILVGGIGIVSGSAELDDPVTGTRLDTAGVYQTQADEFGVVTVDPAFLTEACPTKASITSDVTKTGSITVAAYISRDAAAWNATFTYKCKAP